MAQRQALSSCCLDLSRGWQEPHPTSGNVDTHAPRVPGSRPCAKRCRHHLTSLQRPREVGRMSPPLEMRRLRLSDAVTCRVTWVCVEPSLLEHPCAACCLICSLIHSLTHSFHTGSFFSFPPFFPAVFTYTSDTAGAPAPSVGPCRGIWAGGLAGQGPGGRKAEGQAAALATTMRQPDLTPVGRMEMRRGLRGQGGMEQPRGCGCRVLASRGFSLWIVNQGGGLRGREMWLPRPDPIA